jgi:hypothetical protein
VQVDQAEFRDSQAISEARSDSIYWKRVDLKPARTKLAEGTLVGQALEST